MESSGSTPRASGVSDERRIRSSGIKGFGTHQGAWQGLVVTTDKGTQVFDKNEEYPDCHRVRKRACCPGLSPDPDFILTNIEILNLQAVREVADEIIGAGAVGVGVCLLCQLNGFRNGCQPVRSAAPDRASQKTRKFPKSWNASSRKTRFAWRLGARCDPGAKDCNRREDEGQLWPTGRSKTSKRRNCWWRQSTALR